jgi:soluble lytic murein transglycosylase-like protein
VRKFVVGSLTARTGQELPGPTVAALRAAARVDQLVEESARRHNVDPLLIHSVIEVESNYNPFAVSPKGAEGLMQLIPTTAQRFGVKNSFDVKQNIDAGVRYLKHLQEIFQDDRLTLAAYNAGEGAVIKHNKFIPPYRETQDYVRRVGKRYAELKRKAEKGAEGASPEEGGDHYRSVVSFVDSEGRLHLSTK